MPADTKRGTGTTAERPAGRFTPVGAVLLVAVLTVSGIAASIYWGARLAESSRSAWLDRGRLEAVELSAAIDGALLQVEAQLHALAILFYSSNRVEIGELAEAEAKLPSDGLSVTLTGLAYATLVAGAERYTYEQRTGTLLSPPGRPDHLAPGSFSHFPITLASRRNSLFHRGADLAANPALRSMALSAVRLHNAVVMSRAFMIDGEWLIGFAIAAPNGNEDGLLLGVLGLDSLFERTIRWKPDGLSMRLLQYPSSWEEQSGPEVARGTAEPPADALVSLDHRFTHGEARWNVQWSVLPDFRGGLDLMPAWLLGVGGSVLSLILGLTLGLLIYQNALIRRRVDERTIELRKALHAAEDGNRAKTNFLAVIGHELRTPLNAVIGFSDLLERIQTTSQSQNYVRFVQTGGRHLLRLVNALLEVAQAENGGLTLEEEAVNLGDLIRGAVHSASPPMEETTAEITIHIPDDLPMVRGDAERLELIIVNLVLNAVRAAGDRGRVDVDAQVRAGDGGVRLTFRDTGPGMTESQVTASLRLFEQVEGPLNRRHEGLGIGLPLCRHLLHLHGGSLTIHTHPGRGTVVAVDLPGDRTLTQPAAQIRLRAP
ncbi:MAG: HAMP domain-containing sensor histidine kinase [Thalassobaculaceae bacterium]|nr:HAMP domain-containing sensor histidine kinase [Thalassobaculaceae bacterium]